MDPNPPITAAPSPWRSCRHRTLFASAAAILIAALSGCSQHGPFLQRQTMMGALKSNVAQLESEKDQLNKQVAELKTENRRIETELASVEDKNGELAARLDDARTLISRQGIDEGNLSRSASDSERQAPRRSTPARSQPGNRKAPVAQIPTERRPMLEEDESADEPFDLPPPKLKKRSSTDQSRLDDGSPWLPVARGGVAPKRQVR